MQYIMQYIGSRFSLCISTPTSPLNHNFFVISLIFIIDFSLLGWGLGAGAGNIAGLAASTAGTGYDPPASLPLGPQPIRCD